MVSNYWNRWLAINGIRGQDFVESVVKINRNMQPILDAMAALEAHHPGAHPTTVQEHHQYFVHQASRMDYPRYRALGLPIGSGIIEGTCQTLVKERLDAGGMWWTRVGAQTIGTWRALVNDSFKIPNKDNSMSPKTVVEFPQRRQLNIPKNAS